jgi:hypothetical protein
MCQQSGSDTAWTDYLWLHIPHQAVLRLGWVFLNPCSSSDNRQQPQTAAEQQSEFNLISVTCRESSATPTARYHANKKGRIIHLSPQTCNGQIVHFRNQAYFTPCALKIYSKLLKIQNSWTSSTEVHISSDHSAIGLPYTNLKWNHLNTFQKEKQASWCPGLISSSAIFLFSPQRSRRPTLLSNGYRELFARG